MRMQVRVRILFGQPDEPEELREGALVIRKIKKDPVKLPESITVPLCKKQSIPATIRRIPGRPGMHHFIVAPRTLASLARERQVGCCFLQACREAGIHRIIFARYQVWPLRKPR